MTSSNNIKLLYAP